MSKDLKKILKKEQISLNKLSKNHRSKFETRLQSELHASNKSNYLFLKIAASFLVLIGVASLFYFSNNTIKKPIETAKIISLGSISPDFKNIENYYLVSIYTEISNLEETKDNKELLDDYLKKIGELTLDYKDLTETLNNQGLNDATINALIDNLQLRLKLLIRLKEQINELKNLNTIENENVHI